MTFNALANREEKSVTKNQKKRVLIVSGILCFILIATAALITAYEISYAERAFPGITIGGISVAGMTQAEIEEALYARYEIMIDEGISLSYGNEHKNVSLEIATSPEFNFELINIDTKVAADLAIAHGHEGPMIPRIYQSLKSLVRSTDLSIASAIEVDESRITDGLKEAFGQIEDPGAPTDFVFNLEEKTVAVQIGTQGHEIDTRTFFNDLSQNLENLSLKPMSLEITDSVEPLAVSEVEALGTEALAVLERAPLTLTHTSETLQKYTWKINEDLLAKALVPAKVDGELVLSLEASELKELFTTIEKEVNIEPIDARFQIENGKVIEFVGSQEGIIFDREMTLTALIEAIRAEEDEIVAIAVRTEAPTTSTSEVNDLGITEVLGTGTSDWRGSPANRIANIRHATKKLDGLLFAPGETVSLVSKLRPLTLADGYLPEMVIVGDEIKPEVAGGLCQIGTTAFRAVMNAGLEVNERRNHSLVVGYYNDPSNGNPGTDATLYDPYLDLKFTNTTDHHILLTATFNESNQQLVYTFWGTSDGRKAYYTPPKVLSWRSPGETQYKETTSLPPGAMNCQSAFQGATTSFDYIIEHPDGTVSTENFTSQYRALPRICLVGATPTPSPATPPENAPIESGPPEAPVE